MEWIDEPVQQVLTYFAMTSTSFMTWAIQLGTLIGIIAIGWNCIKLAFGTMEPAKAIIGTITKFLMFIAILNFYPAACAAVQRISVQMGRQAVPQVEAMIKNTLGDLAEKLDKVVRQYRLEAQGERDLADVQIEKASTGDWGAIAGSWDAYATQWGGGFSEDRKQRAEKRLEKIENSSPAKVVASILSVITPVDENGNPTDIGGAARYVMNDINLPGTNFLSPNAMLKIGVLTGNVIWEKEFSDAEGKSQSANDASSPKNSKSAPLYRIFNLVLLFILRIVIIAAMIFAILQYVMCIIEFTIVVSVSIICVPCILMDELKDIAQKVLPSILAQAMKLVIITMSMYFCLWTFLMTAIYVVNESNSFNLSSFAYVMFTIFLAFAIAQSAPKIAVAIMTGQPQLSMGELVGAMGTAAAMGGMAAHTSMSAMNAAKTAVPPAARGAVNALGGMNAVMKAGAATAKLASGDGKSGAAGFMSGAMGEMGHRMGQGLKSKLTNIGHAGLQGKGGGAGGQGVGKNRFDYDSDIATEAMGYGYAQNADGTAKTAGEHISDQGTLAALRAEQNYAKKQMKGGTNNFSSTLA